MRRTGIGLKPLIAVHLVLVLGGSTLLVGAAAVRLMRHGLLLERVQGARALLREFADRLPIICPDLIAAKRCDQLAAWTRRHTGTQPALQALTLRDGRDRVMASSDPAQTVRSLWDALGTRPGDQPPGQDFVVFDEVAGRTLVVEVPVTAGGPRLQGAFDLARTDRSGRRMLLSVSLYGLLVTAAMLLIGWMLLYRLIVRPVDRLLDVAGRISEQGDLSTLLAADRGSEFGRLGTSLGRMARRIEDDQDRLRAQIAKLEELNRDLNQAQQVMIRQEKLASVGLLAAGLAHEVGNPMSAIMGYVKMLRSDQIPTEEQGEILERVSRELARIDKIIRDLLAYSRPGRGETRACAAGRLVEEALDLLTPQKKFKGVRCRVELPAQLPPTRCDPDQVRQVLVNLLFNALHEVDEDGQIAVRVTRLVRAAEGGLAWPDAEGGEPAFFAEGELHRIRPPRGGRGLPKGSEVLVFSVVDDGPGIAEADLARMFDPFFTTKAPGAGTGLGLAICYASVQTMGGEIWAFSRLGQGTQVAFWLPVETAA